jgi:hypothetical protein
VVTSAAVIKTPIGDMDQARPRRQGGRRQDEGAADGRQAVGKGTVRCDGRKIHPMYLVEVKKPPVSEGPWDYFNVLATIPVDQAFGPLSEGGCPLVNR